MEGQQQVHRKCLKRDKKPRAQPSRVERDKANPRTKLRANAIYAGDTAILQKTLNAQQEERHVTNVIKLDTSLQYAKQRNLKERKAIKLAT